MGKEQLKNQELINQIVAQLKRIRLSKGLTLEDVYNDTGIHIARIESTKKNMSLSTIHALLQYYDMSMAEFFQEIEV